MQEKRKSLNQQLLGYSCWLSIIFAYSCTSVKFAATMPGQPKAEYYSFSKLSGNQTTSVDTSVIYVYGNDLVRTYQSGKTEKVYTYKYLIFKSNGFAFFSGSSREAFNQANIYDISGGQYCFYKVEGNELQLELYDHNVKKFTIMYANILPDRVLFYKDKLRIAGGGTSKQNMPFIKSSIKYTRPLVWPE